MEPRLKATLDKLHASCSEVQDYFCPIYVILIWFYFPVIFKLRCG